MTEDYLLTSVTKPSEAELRQAILCFIDGKTDKTGTNHEMQRWQSSGKRARCWMTLKTTAEVITSLAEKGLSEECSTPGGTDPRAARAAACSD